MKKSISVNIKGTIFNIEEDAFEVLKNYLESIKKYFSGYEDSTEIYDDIEARVAEILHEKLNKDKDLPAGQAGVITSEDVDGVIAIMGKAEDFAEQEEEFQAETESEDFNTNEEQSTSSSKDKKRLYKDGRNKIISGVCSGMGHYFAVDPFWIRLVMVLAFFGTGFFPVFIAYLIMAVVLPVNNDLNENQVKKLYRDGENSVLGGVSSGIAKYFGTDPVLVRVLFVVSAFAGFGILTYLVVWIITPEAKTRSEKMQMEGEPITISNIEKNIKDNLNLKDKDGDESTIATILLFPFRLIAQILNGLIRLLKPISLFAMQLLRFVGGFGFLAIGLLMMFVFFILLTVGIGFVSGDNVQIMSNIPMNTLSTTVPGYGMIAAFFAGFFPSLLFVLLGLSLFAKRMLIKPLIFGAIFGFWIISLGVLAGAGAYIAKDFKEESKIVKKEILPIQGEEIILELNGNGSDLENVDLIIKTTADSNIRLVQTIESRGSTISNAKTNAENILYNYSLNNNTITFDETIVYNDSTSFRFQNVDLELYIPYGKKVIINEDLRGFLNTYRTNSIPSISSGSSSSDIELTERIWVSEKKGIKCLNCEDIMDDEDEDINFDDEFNSNQTANTFELEGFSKLKITDAFEVKIIQGDEYKVKAFGDEKDLEDVTIELDDNWLVVDYGGIDNHKIDLDLLDFKDDSRKIKVLIQAPNIDEMDISGACVVEMDALNETQFTLEIGGASELEIESADIDNCNLEVSGASTLEIEGKCKVLTADISGASHLDAFDMTTDIVVIETSGASSAKINVVDKLEAETSGVSSIKYKGVPELDIDEDGLSNIKKI